MDQGFEFVSLTAHGSAGLSKVCLEQNNNSAFMERRVSGEGPSMRSKDGRGGEGSVRVRKRSRGREGLVAFINGLNNMKKFIVSVHSWH